MGESSCALRIAQAHAEISRTINDRFNMAISPKRSFVAVEPRPRCKRRQTHPCAESLASQARLSSQSSRADKVQVQRVISRRSDRGYHEIGQFWIASYLDDQAGL